MKNLFRYPSIIVVLCLGVVGVMLVLYSWQLFPFNSQVESTDNAYVRGNVTLLSPQVSGYITDVKVQDFMPVKKGDVLFLIDDSTYRQELLQAQAAAAQQHVTLQNFEQNRASSAASLQLAEAELQSAQAAESKASLDTGRNSSLLAKGLVSKTIGDELHAALLTAKANVAKARASVNIARQDLALVDANKASLAAALKAAQAKVEVAQINLQHTRIVAPSDGQLGEVSARMGQYVTAGTQMTSITPKIVWVTANFKERQLAKMNVGTPATFTVDALDDRAFKGHVVRISPAAGSEFSVLKADNATGNFTKISQRIAVRIELEPNQPQSDRLRPGMSAVVSIDTANSPQN